jgi:hypothetical protein
VTSSKPQRKPVEIDEAALIRALDFEWRTPAEARRSYGRPGGSADIAAALERLAIRGEIDRKSEMTTVPRRRGGNYLIHYYRRRP